MRGRARVVVPGLLLAAGLAALNIAVFGVDDRYARWRHERLIASASYLRDNGRWDVVTDQDPSRLRTVHMALLRSGKVLLIAGSGNSERASRAHRFQVGVFDPATGATRVFRVPTDVFCAGHAVLPDGRLLVAGGTSRYELLAERIPRPGGVLTIPAGRAGDRRALLPRGTRFVTTSGDVYATEAAVRVGGPRVRVWVTAVRADAAISTRPARLTSQAVPPGRLASVRGIADRLTRDTRDYAGTRAAYLVDPTTGAFTRAADMNTPRWYPSLVTLPDGRVLAASGLDQFGRITPGHAEVYDPATDRWTQLGSTRTLATYPALFTTTRRDTLFFSGSNSGYGLWSAGRTPGLWHWPTNGFAVVHGLRDADMTETSDSVLLPPANDQRWIIMGGGGVGDSDRATARTDIVDLRDRWPRYRPGPDLSAPTRYPNAVILPDDRTLVTGGAGDYRAEDHSALLTASLLAPGGATMTRVADPTVERSYHSSALLLPDGRVLTAGGDPLHDAHGGPGAFETRMEIYSPPYLFRGTRPRLGAGPTVMRRGATVRFASPDAPRIATARLLRPSAVTHTTNLEQRSVALGVRVVPGGGAVALEVPARAGLTPPGWYMLFAVDRAGVPSVARWVRVP